VAHAVAAAVNTTLSNVPTVIFCSVKSSFDTEVHAGMSTYSNTQYQILFGLTDEGEPLDKIALPVC